MTTQEAAAALGVAASTIQHQIAKGRLLATKHGRDWWITEAEIERYRRESSGRPGRRPKP